MKKLLLLSVITLIALASCETYCDRNFPSETIPVDPLPEPSISDVDYPEGPEEMLAIFERMRLPVDDDLHLSDQRAVSAILGEYGEPLLSLVRLHMIRFDDLLGQVE